jgi:hypothetical protein
MVEGWSSSPSLGVARIVAIDVAEIRPGVAKTEQRRLDLALADAPSLLKSADTLVHLAFSSRTEINEPEAARVNVETTSRLLDAASTAGVEQVVVVSSATVYGAWANNPVPLTEDAPLRPNPEFAYAVHKAQVERLVTDWADAHSDAAVAILRPALALAEDGAGWITRCLTGSAGIRAGDNDPPMQFLHLDSSRQGESTFAGQLPGRSASLRTGGSPGDTAAPSPTVRVCIFPAAATRLAGSKRRMRAVPRGSAPTQYPGSLRGSAARHRMDAALDQRGGVRRRARGLPVVDVEPEAPAGARADRRGYGCGGVRDHDRPDRAAPSPLVGLRPPPAETSRASR